MGTSLVSFACPVIALCNKSSYCGAGTISPTANDAVAVLQTFFAYVGDAGSLSIAAPVASEQTHACPATTLHEMVVLSENEPVVVMSMLYALLEPDDRSSVSESW